MSLSLDTIGQVYDLIVKAIEIYHRVENLPKQMVELGSRLERIDIFLARLNNFVKKNPSTAYDGLFAGQKEELGRIIEAIKENAIKAHDLFERYEKGILSREHDLTFRLKWASQIWFSLVDSSPDKIEALMKDIDSDRAFLSDYLSLLNAQGIEQLLNKSGPPRAVSPGPTPSRKDYAVLFVDPYNVARSVVAEACLKLYMTWTLDTKGEWRIGNCQSAGFFVRNKSDCAAVIDNLNYTYPSFKKPFQAGGESPERVPRAALFESAPDYPHQKLVEDSIANRRSSGVTKSIFKDFDFIIVLTNREHDNMIKLKEALVRNEGRSVTQRGKGRLLMLGTYLPGPSTEILLPTKNKDGTNNRANWNRTAAQIKTGVEGFLKKELGWKRPQKTS